MEPIPGKFVDRYSWALDRIVKQARAGLRKALLGVDYAADVAEVREIVVAIMQQACGASTSAAELIAAEFYDALRKQQVGATFGALADSGRELAATRGAVKAVIDGLGETKTPEQFMSLCLDRLDYEIRRAANECLERNALRDPMKPKWARVPTSVCKCDFCIMLAGRGFVYGSGELASHSHPNCRCVTVPSWDEENPAVEGYDPGYYRRVELGMKKATIPEKKISGYCLKENNKARAFRNYLGYGPEDADELRQRLFALIGGEDPTYVKTDEFGERFEHDVIFDGKDGKSARLVVGWIKRPRVDKLQLVTAYVKE